MITVPQCNFCRHYRGSDGKRFMCAAFPDGIPNVILDGEHDHSQPYEGDGGYRYEEKVITSASDESTRQKQEPPEVAS